MLGIEYCGVVGDPNTGVFKIVCVYTGKADIGAVFMFTKSWCFRQYGLRT